MKSIFTLLLLIFLPFLFLNAQTDGDSLMTNLIVQPVNLEDLANNIFAGETCSQYTNIEQIGSTSNAVGIFTNGDASVGLSHGIIISTGSAADAVGPNTSEGTSTNHNMNTPTPDADLDLLLPENVQTYDIAGIEFDFVPTQDFLSFRYVFASEEYCEYANSTFNDVFGLFVSGPGLNGSFTDDGVNIALTPNGEYAGINTINNQNNIPLFNPNSNSCGETTNINDIAFDGYSVVLTAQVEVTPNELYHFKLIIGDAGDAVYDSAIFIETSGFNTPEEIATAATLFPMTTSPSPFDNNVDIVEGCNTGGYVFYRLDSTDNEEAVTLHFDISGTATAGEDYEMFADSITLEAGENSVFLPVNIIADDVEEDPESIIITIQTPCEGVTLDYVLNILDYVPLQLIPPANVTNCAGWMTTLTAHAEGGTQPVNYLWSNGETTSSITIDPIATETYQVTVTDACGQSITDSTTVTVPFSNFSFDEPDTITCATETVTLNVHFDNIDNASIAWTGDIISGENTLTPTVSSGGDYHLFATDTITGCMITAQITVIEEGNIPDISIISSGILTCADTVVTLVATGDIAETLTFNWTDINNNTIGSEATLSVNTPGFYSLTVVDTNGCSLTNSIEVTEDIDTPEEVTVGEDGGLFAPADFTTYQWINCDDGSFVEEQTQQTFLPQENGSYAVMVTNANGCSATSDCYDFVVLGIDFIDNQNFRLTPNPTFGDVVLEMDAHVDVVKIEVFSATGQRLFIENNVLDSKISLPANHWQEGVYFVRISGEDWVHSLRFVRD